MAGCHRVLRWQTEQARSLVSSFGRLAALGLSFSTLGLGCVVSHLWCQRAGSSGGAQAPECGLSSCDMHARLLHSMCDLSTPTTDQTCVPCVAGQIVNH